MALSKETVILGPDPAFGRALAAARGAPATIVFLTSCVALFVIAEMHGSTEDVATLVRFGATERGHVWAGQVWRLVSAGFLHIGILHLLWNVVTMLGWCTPVERALGSARFAMLYLGATVAGSATSLVVHDVVAAGASGAGFGVVGAWLILDARRLGSWRAFAADRRVRRTAGSAALWTLALAGMGVDHAAHFGGFAAGIALAWALTQPSGAQPASRRRAWSVAMIAVALPLALALIPRSGLTRHAAVELDSELAQALQRDDLDSAEQVLARAASAGHSSAWLEYIRAFVLERRGDFDGATRGYETLARSPNEEARRRGTAAAKILLARRLTTGNGMAPDPERGRKLLEEVCSSGDTRICQWLEKNPWPTPAAKESRTRGP